MKDYYNILGVDASASEDQIRTAYKRLAMQHHPDRGGDQSRFQDIQEAYSTLTDPAKKAQWEQQKSFQNGHHPGGFGFSFNFGPDLNDILRQFHGGPFGHFHQPQRNRDMRVLVDLDLASTLEAQDQHIDVRYQSGASKTIQINIPRGVQNGMQMRLAGQGDHANKSAPPGDLYVEFRIRPSAEYQVDGINLRKKVTVNCVDAILGTRLMVSSLDNKQFTLTIPAATQPNTVFRMQGQGLWDINSPTRGDLYIEIIVEIPKSITQSQLDQLKQLV